MRSKVAVGAGRKKRLRYPEIIVREKLKTWHSTALLSFEGELRDFLSMVGGRNDVRLADGAEIRFHMVLNRVPLAVPITFTPATRSAPPTGTARRR